MPLMPMLSTPAFAHIDKAADAGNRGAEELVSYFVGQGVGLVDTVRSCADVVRPFMEEYAEGVEALSSSLG